MASRPQDNRSFRYWAFVSYSHSDKRIAKWLVNALSREPVPDGHGKYIAGHPKVFAPIFRDEAEAHAAHQVKLPFQKALEESHSLIVICSPFSVLSPYVADEIRYYISLGRADRIICLIASGVPNASDKGEPGIESFPLPLRFRVTEKGVQTSDSIPAADRPLGVRIGEESLSERRQALTQLKAGLLGISQSEVEELGRRRRRNRIALAAAAAITLLAGGGFFWDARLREHTTYYRDYVRRWGTWEGVDRIDRKTASHLEQSFAFVTKGRSGPPTTVRILNGSGKCTVSGFPSLTGDKLSSDCSSARACTAHFDYDRDTESLVDQFGHEVEKINYTGSNVAQFISGTFQCTKGKSGISYVSIDRYGAASGESKAGLDKSVRFIGVIGTGPLKGQKQFRPNSAKTYGYSFDYDAGGHVIARTGLGPSGENWSDKDGIASYHYTYNTSGLKKEISYRSPVGNSILNKGYASERMSHDRWGNAITHRYLDKNGNPTVQGEGLSGLDHSFDDRGNLITETFLGIDGKSQPNKWGVVTQEFSYDKNGNRTETWLRDSRGALTADEEGTAGWKVKYDDKAGEIERSYFDSRQLPTYRKSDLTFRTITLRDLRGNEVESRRFDTLGQPTADADGISIYRMKYNDRGDGTEARYYGKSGAPFVSKLGNGGYKKLYNQDGNLTEQISLGTNDLLFPQEGVAIARHKFDDYGNDVEVSYFGVDGRPSADSKEGIARINHRFDLRGQQIEWLFFDLRGTPTRNSEGYFGVKFRYDERGNTIEGGHLDSDGRNPVLDKNGQAGWRSRFDKFNREIETVAVGLRGEPIRRAEGYSFFRQHFDRYGNVVSQAHFDKDGITPVVHRDGYSRTDRVFDAHGNEIEIRYFGVRGNPIISGEGYAIKRSKFDRHHNLVGISYYGVDREPIVPPQTSSVIAYRYDDHGRPIENRFFDQNGKPINSAVSGRSIVRFSYYPSGLMRSEESFDTKGLRVDRLDKGWSSIKWFYHENGRTDRTVYLNAAGKLIKPRHKIN